MLDNIHGILAALKAEQGQQPQQDVMPPQMGGDTKSWVMPDQTFMPGMKPPSIGVGGSMPMANPTVQQIGDVIPFPRTGGAGPDPRATPIFTGRIKPTDPKVVPAY